MKLINFIFAVLLHCFFGTVMVVAAEDDAANKCVDNDDCVKGIPEAGQPPRPGTCCDMDYFFPGHPEGFCVPKAKAKKCAPK